MSATISPTQGASEAAKDEIFPLEKLHDDVILNILRFIPSSDLERVARVSKPFQTRALSLLELDPAYLEKRLGREIEKRLCSVPQFPCVYRTEVPSHGVEMPSRFMIKGAGPHVLIFPGPESFNPGDRLKILHVETGKEHALSLSARVTSCEVISSPDWHLFLANKEVGVRHVPLKNLLQMEPNTSLDIGALPVFGQAENLANAFTYIWTSLEIPLMHACNDLVVIAYQDHLQISHLLSGITKTLPFEQPGFVQIVNNPEPMLVAVARKTCCVWRCKELFASASGKALSAAAAVEDTLPVFSYTTDKPPLEFAQLFQNRNGNDMVAIAYRKSRVLHDGTQVGILINLTTSEEIPLIKPSVPSGEYELKEFLPLQDRLFGNSTHLSRWDTKGSNMHRRLVVGGPPVSLIKQFGSSILLHDNRQILLVSTSTLKPSKMYRDCTFTLKNRYHNEFIQQVILHGSYVIVEFSIKWEEMSMRNVLSIYDLLSDAGAATSSAAASGAGEAY